MTAFRYGRRSSIREIIFKLKSYSGSRAYGIVALSKGCGVGHSRGGERSRSKKSSSLKFKRAISFRGRDGLFY